MHKLKILAISVFAIGFSVLILGGCTKAESTPHEAETAPSVALETTEAVTLAHTQNVTEVSDTSAEAENVFDGEDVFVPDYDSDSYSYEEDDEPCLVNVDGKAYTFYIGDTFSYVFNLKTPEALEDFQAVTNYDSSMLEVVKTSLGEMFPIAGESAVCNTEMPNVVKFNAVNINGMDFTKGGSLITLRFRVLDSGSAAVSTTLEYMDSVLSEPYVDNFRIVGDIDYSEEIK